VRLTPRASRTEIVGPRGAALAVKVNAPAVQDRANDALRRLIVKAVGIPPSRVQIARGHKSRDKLLQLKGVAAKRGRKASGLMSSRCFTTLPRS
jgi:uncharacterized protein YggU (UPF0235/DUF167 family)